jgi:hypothetical protein
MVVPIGRSGRGGGEELLSEPGVAGLRGVEPFDELDALGFPGVVLGDVLKKLARLLQIILAQGPGGLGVQVGGDGRVGGPGGCGGGDSGLHIFGNTQRHVDHGGEADQKDDNQQTKAGVLHPHLQTEPELQNFRRTGPSRRKTGHAVGCALSSHGNKHTVVPIPTSANLPQNVNFPRYLAR